MFENLVLVRLEELALLEVVVSDEILVVEVVRASLCGAEFMMV